MEENKMYRYIKATTEKSLNLYELPKDLKTLLQHVKDDKRVSIDYDLEIDTEIPDHKMANNYYILKIELIKNKLSIFSAFNKRGELYSSQMVSCDRVRYGKEFNNVAEVIVAYEDFVQRIYEPFKEFYAQYELERKEVASQRNIMNK